MEIAQFSTNDINGGAAVASYRLFSGLQKLVDVKYFVKNKTLNDENIINLQENSDKKEFQNLIQNNYINKNRTPISNTFFSFSYCDSVLEDLDKFDIINLHWIEYFVSLVNLKEFLIHQH